MSEMPLIITVGPDRLREVQGAAVVTAHLSYRVCRGPHLYRVGGMNPPRGGLMGLDSRGFAGGGEVGPFCQEMVRECTARGFRGAVCDFEQGRDPTLERALAQLGETFQRRELALYVPESYGRGVPHARVMISSALSGGSLQKRLEEAVERYGGHRVVLAVECMAEDFFLPSPSGSGLPLSQQELSRKLEELAPSVFFSRELCARYFTYMSRDSGAHFVLFDDGGTVRQKVELARRMGLCGVVCAWPEIARWAGELGLGHSGT